MKKKYLSKTSEWTLDLLKKYEREISEIAKDFRLDTYRSQIEIITAEQMMDAYASVGMPLSYPHWSFGKQFLNIEKNYKRGHMGLAYEIVINSNPCIVYLLEENTMAMQALVLAHAAFGHNSFFKGNYLFQAWTSADSIIDYLVFAKQYILQCEERYGIDAVEELLDACHALMNYGVDRYRRSPLLSLQEEKLRQKEREAYLQTQVNDLWRTLPTSKKKTDKSDERFPTEPEENILYFIEKNAPLLEPWQREIVRIVRKIAQYFYPQRQTKIMNEGWAVFWHYTLINEMFERKLVNEPFMVEFLHSHTNVIYQPPFNHPHYNGLNPYTLGFAIFQDLRRICEKPTEEDKEWFPAIVNTDWIETLDFAMKNYKDESFIAQFLSPKVIRDLKLFSLLDDDNQTDFVISAIHNKMGYQKIRQLLAQQYDLSYVDPNIQVYNVNRRGDRALTLRYIQIDKQPLAEKSTEQVLKHLYKLWGFPVKLETVLEDGAVALTHTCPEIMEKSKEN
jgi:spore cortex formation protein SpoVR/YcgB (stage V sporulation)